jgi:hypothetical protein
VLLAAGAFHMVFLASGIKLSTVIDDSDRIRGMTRKGDLMTKRSRVAPPT